MALTSAQIVIVKADILADPVMSVAVNNSDGDTDIAAIYNQVVSPAFYAWDRYANVDAIMDNITWANMTPSDITDTTVLWGNRSLACQGKQLNVQTMLVGRETFNATKGSLRNGLQDALQDYPSGLLGANKQAGWANVKLVLSRPVNRIEKLLCTGIGTQANPADLGFEGSIGIADLRVVRDS